MRAAIHALAAILLVAGCGDDGGVAADRTVNHPDGWSIAVPTGAVVTKMSAGFDVLPQGGSIRRSPATITVRLGAPAPTADAGQRQEVEGIEVRYAVAVVAGGSGGTEYRLSARRPLCRDVLVVHQTIQRELGGRPDFEDAWTVIRSARCRAAR